MQHSVSVVLPNYNGRYLLEKNLPSVIKALERESIVYEIIIPDDASTDDSVEFIKQNFPTIKIITSAVNEGFSKNANKGIAAAQYALILLLNTDVRLKEDYFSQQWKYFDDPETFGVMGSIWSEDGKTLMDAGKYPLWKGSQLKTTVNFSLEENTNGDIPTLFLSGANALIDRKKLIALQGFDERYSPFYMEDVDLSVRAWRNGWKCRYEPKSLCYHKLSESISKHSNKQKIKNISRRNKFIFHDTHLDGTRRFLWKIETLLNLLTRWVTFDTGYYRSYSEFKKLKNERKKYKRSLEEIANELLLKIEPLKKRLF